MDFRLMVFLFLLTPSMEAVNKNFAGPYSLLIQKLAPCSDGGLGLAIFHSHRISKAGRNNYTYSGTIELKKNFDSNKMAVDVNIAVWGNGGWKDNYFIRRINNPCPIAKMVAPNYVKKALRALKLNDCQFVPAGNYTFNEFPIDPDLSVNVLPYNKHRASLSAMHGTAKLGCLAIYFDIVPRRPKRKN